MPARTEAKSVEEIKEILRLKQALKGAVVGTAPVYIETPVVEKQKPVRISTPLLPNKEIDQTLSTHTSTPKKMAVADILAEANIDPVKELLDAYNERIDDPGSPDHGKFVMSPGERRALMKEMLKYTHPMLKSVEHTGMGDNKIVVVLNMPDGSMKTQEIEARGKVINAGD